MSDKVVSLAIVFKPVILCVVESCLHNKLVKNEIDGGVTLPILNSGILLARSKSR